MKVLVTGGSGFIGSTLVDYLLASGYAVVNLSKHTYATNPKILEHLNGNPNYQFVAVDLTDAASLLDFLRAHEFSKVFHLAAETHVDRSFIYPRDFLNTNVVGTFNLLDALRHVKQKPLFIYMGTDEVFGDVPSPYQCKEDDPVNPANPYSASKASAEAFTLAYGHAFDIPTILVRSMNNYGPRQHPEKLLGKIITRNIEGQPYTLYEGDSVRGWIFVEDTASALEFVSDHGKTGQTYHIPAHDYLSVKQVNDALCKLFSEPTFKGFNGRRLKDDERYSLDGTKMRELGWTPTTPLEKGLQTTIDWFRANEWFWKGAYAP